MGSPSAIITLGYGSWGSVNEVVTLGYGIGVASTVFVVGPWVRHDAFPRNVRVDSDRIVRVDSIRTVRADAFERE